MAPFSYLEDGMNNDLKEMQNNWNRFIETLNDLRKQEAERRGMTEDEFLNWCNGFEKFRSGQLGWLDIAAALPGV